MFLVEGELSGLLAADRVKMLTRARLEDGKVSGIGLMKVVKSYGNLQLADRLGGRGMFIEVASWIVTCTFPV